MGGQDDKFAYMEKVEFKYETLIELLQQYALLVRVPQELQDAFNRYPEAKGISAKGELEAVLYKWYDRIIVEPFGLEREISRIVRFDSLKASMKLWELERLQKKSSEPLQLPEELANAVADCKEAASEKNLYRFEKAFGEYQDKIGIANELKDELRLIGYIGGNLR